MFSWPAFSPLQESLRPSTTWNQETCLLMGLSFFSGGWERGWGWPGVVVCVEGWRWEEYEPGETFALENFKGWLLSYRKPFARTKGEVWSSFSKQQNWRGWVHVADVAPCGESKPYRGCWGEYHWGLKIPLSFPLLPCLYWGRCLLPMPRSSENWFFWSAPISLSSWERINIDGDHLGRHALHKVACWGSQGLSLKKKIFF